uniref:two-partner secretion domain-containing protein n=1 Tax=Pseudomonas sp. TaxID=306 RepID=UPI00272AEE8E
MDIRSPLFKHIAAIVAGVMFINPVVVMGADLALDAAAGGNTSLGQAGNGVPIVNIATPSGAGLSHNRFNEYNVGQQGLILNNATGATNSTQLGGIILGNPNLSGGSAGLILNEVTGANQSQLRGYTEVAGQRAGVIVANPHGITCDGCGFINTPRVTLSTGKPVVEQGALQRFDVDGGSVSIQGAGLNATNIDQFDIITRSAQINAELHANQLNIVTGRNMVDAATQDATAKAGQAGDAPQLAVDSSALGGMYAGAIRLIGTEQGVGVRLAGDLAAHAGDIRIDANGQLTLGRVATAADLRVNADGATLTADTYAAGNAKVTTRGALLNQQSMAAGGSVALAGAVVNNEGLIEAGVRQDNSRNADAGLQINAGLLDNSGVIIGNGAATVVATAVDNRQGTLTAQDLQMQVGQIDNAGGRILADRQLEIRSDALNNQAGLIQSRGNAAVRAETQLGNRQGDIIALGNLTLNAGAVDNSEQGLIAARGDVTLNAATLSNRGGEINSSQNINIVAGTLDNSGAGRIIAAQQLALDASESANKGGLVSGGEGVRITGGQLDNSQGGTISARGALTVELVGALNNSQQGALVSKGTQTIKAGSVNNTEQGILSSDAAIDLAVEGSLDNRNTGLISATSDLSLSAGTVRNAAGQIGAGGDLLLQAATLDNSSGQLTSSGALTLALTEALLNQRGQLVGAGPLRIDSQHLDNRQGYLASQTLLSLFGVSLSNAGGTVASRGDLDLRLAGAVNNTADGLIFSQNGNLSLAAGSLDNSQGSLQSHGDLAVDAAGTVSNQGGRVVAQQGDISLNAASVDNSAGGVLHSLTGWLRGVTAGLFGNQGGTAQAQHIELSAGQLNNHAGHLSATGGNLQIAGGDIDNQGGGLYARDGLGLNAASLDNRSGRVGAQAIDFSLAGALNNAHGLIESGNALSLSAAGIHNQHGVLRALGQSGTARIETQSGALDNRSGLIEIGNTHFALAVAGLLNDTGMVRHVGTGLFDIGSSQATHAGGSLITSGELSLSAAQWVHSGLLQAARLTLNIGDFTQTASGQLLATDSLTATGGNWTNHGLIASDGSLSLNLSGTYAGGGRLVSLGDLALGAHSVQLYDTGVLAGGGHTALTTTGEFNNHGRVTSVGNLVLYGAAVNNYGTLGGADVVRIVGNSIVNDQGLLFSGGDMALRGGSLLNRRGDIYSLGSLSYAANDAGHLAHSFRNLSGTVESVGSLFVAASLLENARETFDISTAKVSAKLTDTGCGNCGGDKESTYFRLDEIDRTVATNVSPQAQLVAGGDMRLLSHSLDNRYSVIGTGGNLLIDTNSFRNLGAQTGDVTT